MKNSQGGTLRIHLSKSRDFVGIRSTRCQRKHNQDRYKVLVLNPPTLSPELAAAEAASNNNSNNTNSNAGGNAPTQIKSTEGTQMDADKKTLFYFAIFDGHGGSHTADYLTANLDEYIEQAQPEMVPGVVKGLRKLGGYFRTFRPAILEPFLPRQLGEGGRGAKNERVHVQGKGGKVKPMIFIPHPNATEEDQQKGLEVLQGRTEAMEAQDATRGKTTASTTSGSGSRKDEDEEDLPDEDDDPYVLAYRRRRNATSPLPEGTTSYFGTDRSEYQSLFLREEDRLLKNQPPAELPPPPAVPATMTLEQRLFLSFLQCDTELIRDKYQDGSTASIVVVQSKGAFWETKEDLELVVAHVGDTRVLLCEAPRGECVQLTTDHHPDAVVEAGTAKDRMSTGCSLFVCFNQ